MCISKLLQIKENNARSVHNKTKRRRGSRATRRRPASATPPSCSTVLEQAVCTSLDGAKGSCREIAAKQVSVKLRFHERHSFFSIQPGLSPFLGKGKSFV